jgi:hypothetical protein
VIFTTCNEGFLMAATAPAPLQIEEGDRLYPVPTAAEKLTGQRPHPTTTCRWVRRGLNGHVLPSMIVSGKRMTTLSAMRDFLAAVTATRNEM